MKTIKDEFRGEAKVVSAVDPAVIQTEILEQCSRRHVYYMVFGILMKLRGNVLIVTCARRIGGIWFVELRIENMGGF